MQKYAEFIHQIKLNHQHFSAQDWQKQDIEFHKFSRELKQKFADQLTWREQLRLGSYEIQYTIFRSKKALLGGLSEVVGEVNAVRQEVQDYLKNDVRQDVDAALQELMGAGAEMQKLLLEGAAQIDRSLHPIHSNKPQAPTLQSGSDVKK